jgi:steroid delta-isomerase-like uncharacterized protein
MFRFLCPEWRQELPLIALLGIASAPLIQTAGRKRSPTTRNTSMRLVSTAVVTMALAVSICPGARADTPDNVRTARRVFLETMAEGRFDRLDQIYGPNFVAHGASADYTLEQDSAATKSWRAAMPDLKVTVERTVAGKDLVAVHWKAVGTNTVVAGGMPGNGARIGIEGMTFFRFSSGRIVEAWTIVDIATLRKQLS